jgi:hypothetical protein
VSLLSVSAVPSHCQLSDPAPCTGPCRLWCVQALERHQCAAPLPDATSSARPACHRCTSCSAPGLGKAWKPEDVGSSGHSLLLLLSSSGHLRLNKAAAGAAIQFPRFLGFWEGDNLLSGLRIRELMPLGGLEL